MRVSDHMSLAQVHSCCVCLVSRHECRTHRDAAQPFHLFICLLS